MYFISMKFCCASSGAIKNFKFARKKSTFLSFFFNKIVIFPKITDVLKNNIHFWILEVHPVISTTYLSA